MKKITFWGATLALCAFSALPTMADEKTPAFPGAEGFGRYVTGGRGGKVYHVTNLNDSGEGSLRWALGQSGKKTIVFDVSGTIHLESALNITGNTTLAGQTAPGDGICVADYPCAIKGNNVIVRYMRFRLGNKYVLKDGADGWDGFGGFDQQDLMIDHCSVSWSIDECLSVLGNKNTTVQWCLVAQSLVNSGHTKGAHGYGGNWGGSGASFHHNLIAHHGSRTPRLGPRPTTQLDERMDMRNNVIYNFGGNGCYGGEGMTVNIVNNYYKPGPGSPTGNKGKRIAGVGVRTNSYVATYPAYAPAVHLWGKYYVTGNVNPTYADVTADNWTIGIINQVDASGCDGTWTQATKDSIKLTEPMPFILTTTHTAEVGYQRVLSYVGASLHRDSFDDLMISDTRDGKATYTGSGLSKGFVNSQDDNKPAGAAADWSAWPTLNSTAAPTDTDGDGMPDSWESANGLNPNDASDGTIVNAEGYTNLEVYLNSLVADITTAQYADGEQQGSIVEAAAPSESTEVIIAPDTHNGDWDFGNGYKINTSKGYSEGHITSDFTGIKLSRNTDYPIEMPEGIAVVSVDVKGYSNGDEGGSYVATLGPNTYGEEEYPLISRSQQDIRTYNIALAQPATSPMVVRFGGTNQVVATLTLHVVTASAGISQSLSDRVIDNAIYTLDGRRVSQATEKGVYIINKKKIIVK
ncbi:MAG: pectate lyase [Prevotella sp.]|nr:pectate lyase [Prevotella sp.]